MKIKFNIVLVRPEIPQNTGSIGRICVNAGFRLHLIRPLGFSLEDKYLRRAGMDYWQYLDVAIYDDWQDFLRRNPEAEMYFFSTKTERVFWDCPYAPDSYLVFGNEGHGLPPEFYRVYRERLYTIPMPGEHCRSLNLSNSVAVVAYEGMRRHRG
ncbi:MAG: tRNA (cytidine(34)-2'-O)-methyltransferase [Victivallales bacterium]|nr:tRNA (cytidine(34)-2'-O)-methyltransferase [Victivallales bacterium]